MGIFRTIFSHKLNTRTRASLTPVVTRQVDGGCGVANIKEIAEAGADMFVAGSAIFNNPRTEENYKETITKMRSELQSAHIA